MDRKGPRRPANPNPNPNPNWIEKARVGRRAQEAEAQALQEALDRASRAESQLAALRKKLAAETERANQAEKRRLEAQAAIAEALAGITAAQGSAKGLAEEHRKRVDAWWVKSDATLQRDLKRVGDGIQEPEPEPGR